jgi:hypothetical protein
MAGIGLSTAACLAAGFLGLFTGSAIVEPVFAHAAFEGLHIAGAHPIGIPAYVGLDAPGVCRSAALAKKALRNCFGGRLQGLPRYQEPDMICERFKCAH